MTAVSSIISIKLVVKFTLFTEFCIKSNKQDMKMKHLLFAMAVPALVFLTACSDSGSDGDSAPKPTLSFQTGAGFTSNDVKAGVGDTLKIGIIAKSNDSKLAKVEISQSTNGGVAGVIFDTLTKSNSITFNLDYLVIGKVADVIKLTVTVTDDNGTSATQSLNISIIPPTAFLDINSGGQRISNLYGPDAGAYDLTTETQKKTSDPSTSKDIVDGTPSTAEFNKTWKTGNGSKFARLTSADALNQYTLCQSTAFLYDLWEKNAANATETLTNIAKDNIILVKTGQTGVSIPFGFYIIKITNVVEKPDNTDYIEFSYKGKN
jgi:hypothetical protein